MKNIRLKRINSDVEAWEYEIDGEVKKTDSWGKLPSCFEISDIFLAIKNRGSWISVELED